jgi:quercetin dioxygenase-like cupin family protein
MDVQKIPVSFQDKRGDIIDILAEGHVEYVTLIHTRKGSVRGNHYHKDTFQHLYVLKGKLRAVSRMPGRDQTEAVLVGGDLVLNVPEEHHAFEALEDSSFLVLTRGPRGGDNYEKDTFRLDVPLIAPRD